jgi:hypothetical protein
LIFTSRIGLFFLSVLLAAAAGSLWGLRRADRVRWRRLAYGTLAGVSLLAFGSAPASSSSS